MLSTGASSIGCPAPTLIAHMNPPPQPTVRQLRRQLHQATTTIAQAGDIDALGDAVASLKAIARWMQTTEK